MTCCCDQSGWVIVGQMVSLDRSIDRWRWHERKRGAQKTKRQTKTNNKKNRPIVDNDQTRNFFVSPLFANWMIIALQQLDDYRMEIGNRCKSLFYTVHLKALQSRRLRPDDHWFGSVTTLMVWWYGWARHDRGTERNGAELRWSCSWKSGGCGGDDKLSAILDYEWLNEFGSQYASAFVCI